MPVQLVYGSWIVAGTATGVLLLPAPAGLLIRAGFAGTDPLATRIAGALTLAFPAGVALGWIARSRREQRTAVYGVIGWNGASLLACLLARSTSPQLPLVVVAINSAFFLGVAIWLLSGPLAGPEGFANRRLDAALLVGLVISGLGLGVIVVGGQAGRVIGAPGGDDLLYRLAGAAAVGIGFAVVSARVTGTRRVARAMVGTALAATIAALVLDRASRG